MPRPQLFVLYLAMPVLITIGIFLVWVGWDVGSSYFEGTTDMNHALVRVLMAEVVGVGVLLFAKGLFNIGRDTMTQGEYFWTGLCSLLLYGVLVLMLAVRVGHIATWVDVLGFPSPFLLWAMALVIVSLRTPKEAT